MSSNCYVFKAVDEHIIDKETSLPLKVALKLVRKKTPFLREMKVREQDFSDDFVVNVLSTNIETSNTETGLTNMFSSVPTSLTMNSTSPLSINVTMDSLGGGGTGGGDGGGGNEYANKYAALENLPEDVEVT